MGGILDVLLDAVEPRHWDMGGGECLQIFRVQIERQQPFFSEFDHLLFLTFLGRRISRVRPFRIYISLRFSKQDILEQTLSHHAHQIRCHMPSSAGCLAVVE